MYRFMVIPLLIFLFASCDEQTASEQNSESSDELHIFSENIGWDQKVKAKFVYKGETVFGKVKFRGGISSKYDKHSMTVEFKPDLPIAGLPADDDWILNASYVDKTFQRHKLSFDIFRKMHPDNKAPLCAYLPVYINDSYEGLYVAMQKVNGSWLNFNKKKPGNNALFKDAFIFVEEDLPNVQEPDNYYQQKFPELHQIDYRAELNALRDFLFNSSDEDFAREIGKKFDLRNVMDWQLLLMFTNNDDGLYKNYYLCRDKKSDKFEFIPWDYDHSFGRDGDYGLNLIERELGWDRMILFKRLMASETLGYAEQLKSRWNELRQNVFTEEALNKMIDENDKVVRPYIDANAKRWPLKSKWYSDDNSYEEELEILRKFVPLRLKQLDNFFNTL